MDGGVAAAQPALSNLRDERLVASVRGPGASVTAPHGYCWECGRALTRIEGSDRSHRCPWLTPRTLHRVAILALGLALLAVAILAR